MWFYVSLKRALWDITQRSLCKSIHAQTSVHTFEACDQNISKRKWILRNFRYFVYLGNKVKYRIFRHVHNLCFISRNFPFSAEIYNLYFKKILTFFLKFALKIKYLQTPPPPPPRKLGSAEISIRN